MNIDLEKIMILVKGIDKTEEITSIEMDDRNEKVEITFKRGKAYPYCQSNVLIFRNPQLIDLEESIVCIDNIPVYAPKRILDFGNWIRIIQYNGKPITVSRQSFSVIENGATHQNAQDILNYLKDISQYTANSLEEESFLKKEMEQMTFVHPESVLSCYLNQQFIKIHAFDKNNIIFPFQFNLSQKSALENALANSISVIQGPSGTGKTQTILNIIANLIAVQGKSAAVVSNNNEAVKNVMEKLEKQGYGFLTALLGKASNQDKFFTNMPVIQVDGWNYEEEKEEIGQKIIDLNGKLNYLLKIDREKAQLQQEVSAWQLEQKHFEEYFARQDVEKISKLPLLRATSDRIVSFLADTSFAEDQHLTNKFWYRLKLLFKYGIFDYKRLKKQEVSVLLLLQKEFYQKQVLELKKKIDALKEKLKNASFNKMIEEHQLYSEKFFRNALYKSHSQLSEIDFTRKNYKKKFQDFMKRYPVILSTTYSLRASIPQNYLLDYVIIDEASQVDLITGVLAFSCCRNVIIVGDNKQLPQIVDEKIKSKLKADVSNQVYNYFTHNILSSVMELYNEQLPCEILREHYRCHPSIIEFCNQKYYDGQLIPYTSSEQTECPLVLYKAAEGNHMRRVTRGEKKGIYNQRELDVIVEEVLNGTFISSQNETIGFVTPYRKQADKGEKIFPDNVKSDTVHKYQGREKDVMIMSTVLDNTKDGLKGMKFADDPHIINVAVSRAKKQFVLVTDYDLFFKKGKEIGDLIRYMQYSTLDKNIIESKVVSVFDLLYQRYSPKLVFLKAKMNPNARYQSEEALRALLEEIFSEQPYKRYHYVQGMLLCNLLNTVKLLTTEELNFVNHRASLDFVVFYIQDKTCVLVVEVDGFAFHENNPEQLRRDALKDAILKKYDIPLLRLATNGSQERKKIEKMLEENK